MKRAPIVVAACAAVAAALFLPSIGFNFIWDDFRTQRQALPALSSLGSIFFPPRDVSDFGKYYRPLTYGLYWLLWKAGGGPALYHGVAVALHALCAGLAAGLALRLLRGSRAPLLGAAAAGLIVATHPVHVESVAWVGAMGEMFGTSLLLAALIAYDSARRDGHAALYPVSLVLVLLAMLSKESLIAAPALAAGLELAPREPPESSNRSRAWRVAGLALTVAIYFSMRRAALGSWISGAKTVGVGSGDPTAVLAALAYYGKTMIGPLRTCPFVDRLPPFSAADALALLAIVLVAGVALWRWRRAFVPAFGVLWAAAAISPALVLAASPRVATTIVAERYAYLPSIGLSVAVGGLIAATASATLRRALTIVVVAVAAVFAVASLKRQAVFASDETLWSAAAECAPGHCLPWLNLGDGRQARGDIDGAARLYREALARDCDDQERGMALSHLGVLQFVRGDVAAAEGSLREAKNLAPWYSVPPYMLARMAVLRALKSSQYGDSESSRRDYELARAELTKALELRPNDPEYLYVAGQVAFVLGDEQTARAQLTTALQLNPEHEAAPAARNLLAQMGR